MGSFSSNLKNQNFIDNRWVNGLSTKSLTIIDKYDQSEITTIQMVSSDQIEETLNSAEKGFREFKKWTPEKRSEYLLKLKNLLEVKREWFENCIVKEAGKPLSYGKAELNRCLSTLQIAANEALLIQDEEIDINYDAGIGKKALIKRFPIGIILAITPFNFPLNLLLHKLAPALASGCSIIIKPAPQTPLSALAFADLIQQAAYPNGVCNVIMSDIPETESLVRHPSISKLSFTGSDTIGWHLKSIAGKKKVTLELGGNAAVIVDQKTDLPKAAKEIVIGCYLYAGQICISTQRIYAVAEVYDQLLPLLLKEISQIKTGDPSNSKTIAGPIISNDHLHRIHNWVNEAIQMGAKLLCGGSILNETHNLYAPTLLTHTHKNMKAVTEEVFGPVAIIEQVSSFQEAIIKVNDSRFGLQAGVYTNTPEHIEAALNTLEVGGVIINNVPGFRVDGMPYGGVKDSGLGREGVKYAIQEMTEPRLLVY